MLSLQQKISPTTTRFKRCKFTWAKNRDSKEFFFVSWICSYSLLLFCKKYFWDKNHYKLSQSWSLSKKRQSTQAFSSSNFYFKLFKIYIHKQACWNVWIIIWVYTKPNRVLMFCSDQEMLWLICLDSKVAAWGTFTSSKKCPLVLPHVVRAWPPPTSSLRTFSLKDFLLKFCLWNLNGPMNQTEPSRPSMFSVFLIPSIKNTIYEKIKQKSSISLLFKQKLNLNASKRP